MTCTFCHNPIGELGFKDVPAHISCYLLGYRDEEFERRREEAKLAWDALPEDTPIPSFKVK